MKRGLLLLLAGCAFFLSGGAGLVYQVAWQRILALQSGVGIYSIAMIVAAFMAGLGLGSHLGGLLSLRLSARGALYAFAVLELGIGLFGAVSCFLYYDVLYGRHGWLYSDPWRAGALHFLSLLLPTGLMGMSLPFLARALVADARTAGSTVGVLYGVNLLGASVGALVAPWVLIRLYGIDGAVRFAAVANVLAGLFALALAVTQRQRRDEAPAEPPTMAGLPAGETRLPLAAWMALYALSGFCALSLEIVWFRILDIAVKATAFTFGTMLFLYLLGSAIGSLAGARLADRQERPLRLFLLCQCALLVYSAVGILLITFLPPSTPLFAKLFDYWRHGWFAFGTNWAPGPILGLYLLLPLVIFGPPTVLMGLSFPILQRAVHDDPRTSGRKVGLLQAANIGGCVAGSLLVGLLALDWIGTTGTFRLLMVCGVAFGALGMRRFGPRSIFGGAVVVLALLAVALPSQRRFWLRLHGSDAVPAELEEDATGVGAILSPRPQSWVVYVNGKAHSWIPYGGAHTRLGAAPAIVHPAPVDVAIIGLGSADTAWAAGCRQETRTITVFEISGPQPRNLQRLAVKEAGKKELEDVRSFLADPRVSVVIDDGRNAILHGDKLYDVIEADALWPTVAYSGNLYSVEFFRQCAKKLKPGGIICTWAPTPRIYASFTTVMPHVIGVGDRTVLLGSNQPLPVDHEVWQQRLRDAAVRGYLGEEGADAVAWLLELLRPLHRTGRRHSARDLNRDLFPRDEFLAER
jgi:spermidine synthase